MPLSNLPNEIQKSKLKALIPPNDGPQPVATTSRVRPLTPADGVVGDAVGVMESSLSPSTIVRAAGEPPHALTIGPASRHHQSSELLASKRLPVCQVPAGGASQDHHDASSTSLGAAEVESRRNTVRGSFSGSFQRSTHFV